MILENSKHSYYTLARWYHEPDDLWVSQNANQQFDTPQKAQLQADRDTAELQPSTPYFVVKVTKQTKVETA